MARRIDAEIALIEGGTWETAAWLLWTSAGERSYTAIRDALKTQYADVPVQGRTVKKAIDDISQSVALAMSEGLLSAAGEYIASLEAALKEAWKLYRTSDNSSASVAALKLVVDLLEKIAAAKGVVTQRKAEELTGKDGGPVQTQAEVVVTNEHTAEVLAILAQCGALEPDPDASGETAPDEVHTP